MWYDRLKYFKGFNRCIYCQTKIWKPKVFCKPKHAVLFAESILKHKEK